jgi:hypothetical protein
MRIAGHSTITVSQEYVGPAIEAMERAFERRALLTAERAKNDRAPLQYPLRWQSQRQKL